MSWSLLQLYEELSLVSQSWLRIYEESLSWSLLQLQEETTLHNTIAILQLQLDLQQTEQVFFTHTQVQINTRLFSKDKVDTS